MYIFLKNHLDKNIMNSNNGNGEAEEIEEEEDEFPSGKVDSFILILIEKIFTIPVFGSCMNQ